jgi:uncharacterized Zn finger protein (UPF0148 family)
MSGETCAACGLDVASFRVEREGQVYCRAYCSRQAELPNDGAEVTVRSARERIVQKVRAKGARA